MTIRIEVRGDIEKAIRRLKKQMQQDGTLRETRQRRYHEKPSVRRKRKQAEARRRKRRQLRH